METKTYSASNVPAALDLARRELGAEAMLLNSKPASADMRSFGRLEVTFAYDPLLLKAEAPKKPIDPAFSSLLQAALHRPENPLDEIRGEIAALRDAVRARNPLPGDDPWKPAMERLMRCGLGAEISREIAEAALRRDQPEETAVLAELADRVRVRHFSPLKVGESRMLALLGPPGRGKTTTLVKIAFRFGLEAKIPVRVYSAGIHPVGGAEQMARYASILGVPFNWFETVEGLHLALSGDRWRGLSLIDTPGLSPADTDEIHAWDRFFRLYPDMERHFVLRADTRSADIYRVMARMEGLHPTHLLFTGLDEVSDYAAVLETAMKSGVALGFGGNGPKIPEDLVEIEAAQLIKTVWATGARNTLAVAA